MQSLRLGFISLARPTFDIPLAKEVTRQARDRLAAAGFELVGPDDLVSDLPAAQSAAHHLSTLALDLLVIYQATFADSTLVTTLAENIEAPLLLWAIPEPRTGGRLRLNSLCGINLAGHALTLKGKRYYYVYTNPDDPRAIEKVKTLAQAGRAYRLLRNSRMGVIGEPPAGMDSCHLDAPALEAQLGLQVQQYELHEVFSRAQTVLPDQIDTIRIQLDSQLDNLSSLDQGPLNGTLSAYAAMRQLTHEEKLDSLAVRCWPEFFTEMGCAACGAMSMLTNEQIPCSCEADANGTVTQLILQWLSGEAAFGSDLVSVEPEENIAVLWHCGLAPLAMADPNVQPRGSVHSNRGVPLVMEFPLKPGRVTIARLSRTGERAAPLRLVVGSGEMLSASPSFSGTSGVLRFDRPASEVLDTILSQGLEHHISITYGDHMQALLELAEMLELPVLHL